MQVETVPVLRSSDQRKMSGAKADSRKKGTKPKKSKRGKAKAKAAKKDQEKDSKEPKAKKPSLVDEAEKGRLKKFLGLHMVSFFLKTSEPVFVFVHFLLCIFFEKKFCRVRGSWCIPMISKSSPIGRQGRWL